MLTQAKLKELLHYSYESGLFVWRVSRGRVAKGQRAGSSSRNGYFKIKIDGVSYYAHRLVWLYVYGYTPEYIDHIDRNKKNNLVSNLREATKSQNQINQNIQSNNTSGYKGVHFNHTSKRWQARIAVNGERKYIGSFDCKADAYSAYCEAARNMHGEFANLEQLKLLSK